MEKTKRGYWKEIAKTFFLVALITCVTWFVLAPFVWGFATTLSNSTAAGRVAEGIVICLGIYLSICAIERGVRRICFPGQGTSPSEVPGPLQRASEIKKIEKVILPSLVLVITGLYLFCSGNYELGTSCFVGFVILLMISAVKRFESLMQSWTWLCVWLILSVLLILYGPAFFAAEAQIVSVTSVAVGFINFWLATMGIILAAGRLLRLKANCAHRIVPVVGIGVCGLGFFMGIYLFPNMAINLGCLVISLMILGVSIWQKADGEALIRYKNGILYPCLLILLLVGICKFSMLVRQVTVVHEARQNSEQAP